METEFKRVPWKITFELTIQVPEYYNEGNILHWYNEHDSYKETIAGLLQDAMSVPEELQHLVAVEAHPIVTNE